MAAPTKLDPRTETTRSCALSEVAIRCISKVFGVCIQEANDAGVASIFGFAQYISTLALLVVVFNVSDFRYRYRLHLTRYPVRPVAFTIGCVIGISILAIDVWFYNKWPIPSFLNHHNNLRAILAVSFLAVVFYLILKAFVKPPRYSRSNYIQYFKAVHDHIGNGSADQIAVVAEEIDASIEGIIDSALNFDPKKADGNRKRYTFEESAGCIVMLLGDRRICSALVEKSPWTIVKIFDIVSDRNLTKLPLAQFSRNVGAELVFNARSPLHNEVDGYYSGFFGYTKPISNAVFGNYKTVEALAVNFGSPLDLAFDPERKMRVVELRAYVRASLVFCRAYFKSDVRQHSYAFVRMMSNIKSHLSGVSRLQSVEGDFWLREEYLKLEIIVTFVRDLIDLLDECGVVDHPKVREKGVYDSSVHGRIADLAFEVVFAASCVTAPTWTCWSVQHNAVWSQFFGFEKTSNWEVVRRKILRLILKEVKRMEEFPNFKGGRLIGLCLNTGSLGGERYPEGRSGAALLFFLVSRWVSRNYLYLISEHPKVAEAMLHGSVEFDKDGSKIIKSFTNDTRKERSINVLKLLGTEHKSIKTYSSA